MMMSFFYFLPWLIEPRVALGFYIISFVWFLFGWSVAIAHMIILIKTWKNNQREACYHGCAIVIILLSYAIVITGAVNGYLVTV